MGMELDKPWGIHGEERVLSGHGGQENTGYIAVEEYRGEHMEEVVAFEPTHKNKKFWVAGPSQWHCSKGELIASRNGGG